MGLVHKLRSRLTYANVMSSIAVFVALSGGAYALTIPKGSVGSRQLKRNAVTGPKIRGNAITSVKVRDHSLRATDLAAGVIPRQATAPAPAAPPPQLVLGGARAADTDPPATPGTPLKSTSLSLTSAGKAFVLATVNGPFLTCGTDPCEATWGVYVDNQPVPAAGLRLQAAGGGGGDGYPFYTLYGLTPSLQAGSHTVTLSFTSAGNPAGVADYGTQLGALALTG
jgi:hypothetical protein